MKKDKEKEKGEVSRRDFLVGTGAIVTGIVGAGMLAGCGGEAETVTTTKTVSVPTTVTTTKTVGDGTAVTVTDTVTTTVGAGETVTKTVSGPTVTTTVVGDEAVLPYLEPEENFLVPVGGNNKESAVVDVKNGKVIRIRPLHYDWKYTKEELADRMWKMEARGKTLEPSKKSLISYFQAGQKKRIYSTNRILYPLQRVDWEPGGDPAKINPQNRGISKFKRISWDEAAEIVASEIKRVQDKYGHLALFIGEQGPHVERKTVHSNRAINRKLMSLTTGCSNIFRNADSWEGWEWGAKHVWGSGSHGEVAPNENCLINVARNTDMLVWQGGDFETTAQEAGQFASKVMYWLSDLGIKHIFISPDVNYATAVHADKWIPVLPNRDDALQMAIVYTWLVEDTWDKEYVATHVVGMDKIEAYIMGDDDGVAKTPAWASPKCGVPEWTIKALAREWAKKVTCPAHFEGGSFIRGPYSTEPARWQCVQLGMQGLGKPGITQAYEVLSEPPGRSPSFSTSRARIGFGTPPSTPEGKMTYKMEQFIGKCLTPLAILDPPQTWWGHTGFTPVEDQFEKYTYPIPADEGGTEIHMWWMDKNCYTTCWNEGFLWIDALRSPKLECVVEQAIWLENDCYYSDIVLPATTAVEDEDIQSSGFELASTLYYQPQAIKPVGESLSDYGIVCEIAKKLEQYGGDYADAYSKLTQDRTVLEWVKYGFENSGAQDLISWDELVEKKYFIAPADPDWEEEPFGMIRFYEDPENNPIALPTGKLEFYSERLAEHFPDDKERGPMPKFVIGGPASEGWYHDESLFGERAKEYPLLIVSNHGRWKSHSQFDDVTWMREIPTCKVKGPDGYLYETLWINPTDAASRGIVQGDIVKIFNERGIVLGGAYVTERIRPGAVSQDHGARLDPITDRIDRGGANNLISPLMGHSGPHCWGMATSGFLVEVEKLSGDQYEEWRRNYPEAFARDYDPASGLRFNGWVEGGE
ncbi:molybdopterin-dependent oxidoreductase [Chloroflexota bacterium]